MNNNSGKFLYAALGDQIQGRIEKGVSRISEKLQSLQALCRETGCSMTTAFQTYALQAAPQALKISFPKQIPGVIAG